MSESTINKAIRAYGGEACWKKAKRIEAEISVRGLAFTLKQRPFFEHALVQMEIARPVSSIIPIGRDPSIRGRLDSEDVWLEDVSGKVLETRNSIRRYFPFGKHAFRWDDLEMSYFANYAMWNYLTLPSLLMNEEILWSETEQGIVKAVFPTSIPTHSKNQEFRFDKDTGLLCEHLYTVDIIGRYARATHTILAHNEDTGLIYPSRRKVTPQTPWRTALPGPILIDIEIHRFRLIC
ncbi:MAG TPA: hypothetical protein PLH27_01040 [bacterium]|nr:hypothetical protein [bacterium]HMW35883.1 hypothetical protein [bacterium]HMY35137.1 hypothetical protein [bacterium]HMZ04504.1 hypothetical protein [bacterium]HNB08281.1 hypothetical protein [bacterium]